MPDLAVVAGASGAIGSAIVARLKDTMRVIATNRQRPPSAMHPNVEWLRFDAHDATSGQALADAITTSGFGLSALFFCIGAPSQKQAIADTGIGEFSDVYANNVVAFVATWRALRSQARAAKTSVVLLGSEAARTRRVGNAPYSAAKAALEAIVQTLAREEMDAGVRVNMVSPSLVASPLAEEVLRRKGITDVAAHYHSLPWGRALTADVDGAQASLRRFTLKLRFEPLNPVQAALAFERFFGVVSPRRLADGLTPGDFATVRRKRDLLTAPESSVLADWLDEEAEAKGTRVQPIGFGRR